MVQGAWLLLELAVLLGIIYDVLVFQAYRMQELWGHGGFHPNFKRSPWWSDALHGAMHEDVKRKPQV